MSLVGWELGGGGEGEESNLLPVGSTASEIKKLKFSQPESQCLDAALLASLKVASHL